MVHPIHHVLIIFWRNGPAVHVDGTFPRSGVVLKKRLVRIRNGIPVPPIRFFHEGADGSILRISKNTYPRSLPTSGQIFRASPPHGHLHVDQLRSCPVGHGPAISGCMGRICSIKHPTRGCCRIEPHAPACSQNDALRQKSDHAIRAGIHADRSDDPPVPEEIKDHHPVDNLHAFFSSFPGKNWL